MRRLRRSTPRRRPPPPASATPADRRTHSPRSPACFVTNSRLVGSAITRPCPDQDGRRRLTCTRVRVVAPPPVTAIGAALARGRLRWRDGDDAAGGEPIVG